MAAKTKERHAALKETLIDLAEDQIREHGMQALRARVLAEEAGCSIGTIYNIFDDLNDLMRAVNLRTLKLLGDRIQLSVAEMADRPPMERLVAMANAYVDVAREEPNLWRAGFSIPQTRDDDIPKWYLDGGNALFAFIDAPIRELTPEVEDTEIRLYSRALFSAIHGLVSLSLDKRLAGVPETELKRMIAMLLYSIHKNHVPTHYFKRKK